MKKILLDTNAYSGYLRGRDDLVDQLSRAEIVYMSPIVMGELYAGFRGGSKYQENIDYLNRFLAKSTVRQADLSRETSEIFGDVKDRLKRSGTPLPVNDIWIASQTLELGAVLVTHDRHFSKIPGLRVAGHCLG